jgi:hypothetical protein
MRCALLLHGSCKPLLDPADLKSHLSGLALLGLHPQAVIAALAAASRSYGISRIAAHAYLDVQDSVFCFWKSSHDHQPFSAMI